jgi:predicted nucleic acid-binding protein
MNGKEILVDTNIILYLLEGSDTLEGILQGKDIYLSFITELELIEYKGNSEAKEKQILDLLNDCSIISMNNLIKEKYVELRKQHHLKLADTIIAATAMVFDMPVITADKQFKTVNGLRMISYQHTNKRTNSE